MAKLTPSDDLSPAQYWEAQAEMWHENYKELLASERDRVARMAVQIKRLRETLVEARDELQAFCEELHGEDYNNTKINAALAETGGGHE